MGLLYSHHEAKIGDYVLATKYYSGDPQDHWCVGWLGGKMPNRDPVRYDIVDEEGNLFRGNGFRRIKPITELAGKFILANRKIIVASGFSVWWWLRNANAMGASFLETVGGEDLNRLARIYGYETTR